MSFDLATRFVGSACGITLFAYVLPQLILRPAWPAVVQLFGGDARVMNVFGSLAIHAVVYIVVNAFFLALYAGFKPLQPLQKYRIIPQPWPWQRGEKERASFFQELRTALLASFINNILISVPLGWFLFKEGQGDIQLETFPSAFTVVWQLAVCLLCEDAGFYWMHRLLHEVTPLYSRFHVQHHRWRHSISIAAEHSHPVEFLLSVAIPFVAGPRLLNVHCSVLLTWMAWRVASTLEGHSGYCFPFSLLRLWPPAGMAHDAHHSVIKGNYGSTFPVWDWLCGTTIPDEFVVSRGKRKPGASFVWPCERRTSSGGGAADAATQTSHAAAAVDDADDLSKDD